MKMVLEKVEIKTQEMLTCQHCGHTGPEVIERTSYIGGSGLITVTECQDIAACWQRWEAGYGYRNQRKAI